MHSRIEVFGNDEVGYYWRRIDSQSGIIIAVGSQAMGSKQEARHSVHMSQLPPYHIVDLWGRVNEIVTEEYTDKIE
jgi:hypothetical protein